MMINGFDWLGDLQHLGWTEANGHFWIQTAVHLAFCQQATWQETESS